MEQVVEQAELDRVDTGNGEYAVKAYNNDHTPFTRVLGVFIISCGYTEEVAYKYTKQIHEKGSSVCYWSNENRCKEVVNDFKKVGVLAEVVNAT